MIPLNRLLFSALLGGCLFSACSQSPGTVQRPLPPRDTAINITNAYSTLFLDSTYLEKFLAGKQVPDTIFQLFRSFYNPRNYTLAWFDSSGISEQAGSFWNRQQNYLAYGGDSSIYNPFLEAWMDSVAAGGPKAIPDSLRPRVELELTRQFFRYTAKAYGGNSQLNSRDLGWFIPRRKVDVLAYLDTIIAKNGVTLADYEPVNRQYGLLRKSLNRYYELEKKHAWEPLQTKLKKISLGDTGQVVTQIRERLALTGDLDSNNHQAVFDTSLVRAVRRFQHRYGLKEDGVVGGATLQEMNRPITYRIRQILVNMERLRWAPAEPRTDYILVNIPEFRLHAYESGNLAFNMDVVVGSNSHNTVIFTGNLKNIVFSPYWYVPPGILKAEVLPGIKRNSSYLARHNMEWNGGNVRQKPGPKNSLGLVKFLFPNSYNIYLHDTPSKSLFNESKRNFSHGCIRVAEPKKLAQWLLREDSSWTSAKMDAAMHAGKEKWVTVTQTLPVYIGYFTSWVDRNGELNFREDIYGHDQKMMDKMFAGDAGGGTR